MVFLIHTFCVSLIVPKILLRSPHFFNKGVSSGEEYARGKFDELGTFFTSSRIISFGGKHCDLSRFSKIFNILFNLIEYVAFFNGRSNRKKIK